MKRSTIISAIALAILFAVTACEKGYQVEVAGNASRYQSAQNAIVSLRNEDGQAYFTKVEMHDDNKDVEITGKLLGTVPVGAQATLSLGTADMVEAYNEEYGTAYEVFPIENASFSDDELFFEMGSSDASESVQLSLSAAGLRSDVTYMLPLVSTTTSKGVVAGEPMYLLVEDLRSIPDNDKGVKIFTCVESDDHSILDNLAFRLKKSGQYLIDVLIIFTSGGDVNFNTITGEINMPSNRGTLNHIARQELMIKEAHRRGVKVIATVTTNGIEQLDLATAKDFAKKLANFVYAHNLDGMFFDTEYSGYDASRPGFGYGSTEKMARFLLELKRCMPDKMVVTYLYGALSGLRNISTIDGVALKDFVDYGLNDYGASQVPSGLGKERVGILSDNFSSNYMNICCDDEGSCRRAGEYGAHMFYCLPSDNYLKHSGTRRCLDNIARLWYNDEILYDPLEDLHLDW